MAEASARHNRMVREQVEATGGRVVKTVGEAFRVVFADPSAALAAAVAVQRAVGAEPWPPGSPIRVRMALHSGACVERDGDYVGPVVNRAAGLLAAGHGGQVLVSGAACELLADRLPGGIGLRDLGEHQLKDLGRAERVFQVTGPGLAEGFGPLRSLDDPALRHNLPSQATSFVGRAAELAELRSLVAGGSRLVTITGPGGIGKSRLALQVAAEALDGAGDGVWLAELAPVADPELVARTVAAVLGVREEPGRPVLDTLAETVGDRYLLVVLDNAEHVLGAAAKLADAMLRSCPRAYLLVTSREPLGVGGEHVFRVPPLPVPPADLAAPDKLAAFESVQLFAEHAAMHRQGFAVDEANAAAVAAVCVRLDGIPLALELAAARLGSLSVSEISSRLDQRFRLLTGGSRTALPRHQTLRALIDWSYDLLSSEEQMVLDRLSVFAGGWTLAAAEAVTSAGGTADWQVLDLLAALVDKSLVQAEDFHGFDPVPAAGDSPPVRRRTPRPAARLRAGRNPCRPPRSLPGSGRDRRPSAARLGRGRVARPARGRVRQHPGRAGVQCHRSSWCRARPAAGRRAAYVRLLAWPQWRGPRGTRCHARALRCPPADSLRGPCPDHELQTAHSL